MGNCFSKIERNIQDMTNTIEESKEKNISKDIIKNMENHLRLYKLYYGKCLV